MEVCNVVGGQCVCVFLKQLNHNLVIVHMLCLNQVRFQGVAEFTDGKFDFCAPTLFEKDSGPIEPLLSAFESGLTTAENSLTVMLAKKANSGLRGSYQQIEVKKADIETALAELDNNIKQPDHELSSGFAPFGVVIREKTLRLGVTSYPMTGVGGFVQARGDIGICLVDAAVLIDKSEFQVYDQFDSALDDKRVSKEPWPMAILSPGQTLWVPYGMIPLVCSLSETSAFAVIPWPVNALLKAASSEAIELLVESAIKYGKKHISLSPWDRVVPAFEALLHE
jgi:hypothetical protein